MVHEYANGNYMVKIDDVTGTKERYTEDEDFKASFPESLDCNITYFCDGDCDFCYAGCSKHGKHANLDSDYINNIFIPSLHPYTEIALNGNDLSHPQLYSFLQKLKSHNVIANITVNQKHFMKNLDYLHRLYSNKLVHGIGVSLVEPDLRFVSEIQKFPTAVIHVIAGLVSEESIRILSYHNLKILILGYKRKGRGNGYYVNNAEDIDLNIQKLSNMIPSLISKGAFNVISFDNLALTQLGVRFMMSEEQWNVFYMGDDGKFTFFVDLVNNTYAKDSLVIQNHSINNQTVLEMFKNL